MPMDLFDRGEGQLINLSDIHVSDELKKRLSTYVPPIDHALGGGFVNGGVLLFGGEPGVGKSTLLLQLLDRIAAHGHRCVYDSAEESAEQLKMTSERALVTHDFAIGNIPEVHELAGQVQEYDADILVIDSIQGFFTNTCDKRPGSITQLSESCNHCIKMAKGLKIPLVIICQLNTQGGFKGPKDLEHNVDVVGKLFHGKDRAIKRLIFEKNRFGPTLIENLLPWLPDVGRYNLDQEIAQVQAAKPADSVEEKKKKPAKRKGRLTDEEKLLLVAEQFLEYPEKSHRMLAQFLVNVAGHYGSFAISEHDHTMFGYKKPDKFKILLARMASMPHFTMMSRDPITLLV